MKFFVDMPLPPALAQWLATQGHDAVHASAVGLAFSTDAEILTRAKQEARTVVTADLDYPRLLALAGAEGPSLILFVAVTGASTMCRTDAADSSRHGRERVST